MCQVVSAPRISKLTADQRGCFFPGEGNLTLYSHYSSTNCRFFYIHICLDNGESLVICKEGSGWNKNTNSAIERGHSWLFFHIWNIFTRFECGWKYFDQIWMRAEKGGTRCWVHSLVSSTGDTLGDFGRIWLCSTQGKNSAVCDPWTSRQFAHLLSKLMVRPKLILCLIPCEGDWLWALPPRLWVNHIFGPTICSKVKYLIHRIKPFSI